MAKGIKEIDVHIRVKPNNADLFLTVDNASAQESADIVISIEEYPDWEKRKGIEITLSPTANERILNHVKEEVYPQAEASK